MGGCSDALALVLAEYWVGSRGCCTHELPLSRAGPHLRPIWPGSPPPLPPYPAPAFSWGGFEASGGRLDCEPLVKSSLITLYIVVRRWEGNPDFYTVEFLTSGPRSISRPHSSFSTPLSPPSGVLNTHSAWVVPLWAVIRHPPFAVAGPHFPTTSHNSLLHMHTYAGGWPASFSLLLRRGGPLGLRTSHPPILL